MARIYCIKRSNYRKFKQIKIYIIYKKLVLFITCVKCEILRILGLINNMEEYQMNILLLKIWLKKM